MNVTLTLTGRQTDESGIENITETEAHAEYYEKNGTLYIFYEETPEGTNATIKNTIKLKNHVLEMSKKGAYTTRMVFDAAHDFQADYQTPFGSLLMDIHTESVTCVYQDELPRISAKYTLQSGEQLIATTKLTIKLRKE